MNRFLLTLLALASAALPAFAQSTQTCNTATPAVCTAYMPSNERQIKGQAVAASTVVVTTGDAYLKGFTISNPTSGAISFSLCDRQSVPVCLVPAVSVAANTAYIIVWPDGRLYWAPGGFTFLASGVGLTAQGSFLQ